MRGATISWLLVLLATPVVVWGCPPHQSCGAAPHPPSQQHSAPPSGFHPGGAPGGQPHRPSGQAGALYLGPTTQPHGPFSSPTQGGSPPHTIFGSSQGAGEGPPASSSVRVFGSGARGHAAAGDRGFHGVSSGAPGDGVRGLRVDGGVNGTPTNSDRRFGGGRGGTAGDGSDQRAASPVSVQGGRIFGNHAGSDHRDQVGPAAGFNGPHSGPANSPGSVRGLRGADTTFGARAIPNRPTIRPGVGSRQFALARKFPASRLRPARSVGSARFYYHGRPYAPFVVARYRWPAGYVYQPFVVGAYLPVAFWSPGYFMTNYDYYGLDAPAPENAWIRYGPDALQVDESSGQVDQVVPDTFEESDEVAQADLGPAPDSDADGLPTDLSGSGAG